VLRFLLAHPAIDVNITTSQGNRCLYVLMMKREDRKILPILEILLQRSDIQVNAKNYLGRTAFWFACRHACVETVARLLQHPTIDPLQEDQDGITPLMLACIKGNFKIVSLLVQSGKITPEHWVQRSNSVIVDPHWKEFAALSSLEIAERGSHEAILRCARQAIGAAALRPSETRILPETLDTKAGNKPDAESLGRILNETVGEEASIDWFVGEWVDIPKMPEPRSQGRMPIYNALMPAMELSYNQGFNSRKSRSTRARSRTETFF
jgi:hypothetical protein